MLSPPPATYFISGPRFSTFSFQPPVPVQLLQPSLKANAPTDINQVPSLLSLCYSKKDKLLQPQKLLSSCWIFLIFPSCGMFSHLSLSCHLTCGERQGLAPALVGDFYLQRRRRALLSCHRKCLLRQLHGDLEVLPGVSVSCGSDLQPLLRGRYIRFHRAVIHVHFLTLCFAGGFGSPCDSDLPSPVPTVHHSSCHLRFIIGKDPALNH